MSEIIIRKAEPRDFEAVQEIQRAGRLFACLDPNCDSVIPINEMEEHSGSPNGLFGVAEVHDLVVGFIFGEKLVAAWVLASYFAVRPDYRGSEVFIKLGAWFVEEAKKRGAKHIFMYTDANNKKLINFYKRFDFRAGGDYVEMIKEI
ncbi:MAG: GNAT family N-acetyltransferase [Alphaproteobacteria bacterium]|nr:GNAT family N-acetyltransferase [Alphaproteobacteria bacterium]MCL2758201.1 GNAT family N-acetyltransferase [Alphaproteobacteria bacterium]